MLGLPTGDTPRALYAMLALRAESGACDLRAVSAYAVDEFLGARRDTPGTNSMYFRRDVNVPVRTLNIPDPASAEPDKHIAAFADAIRRAETQDARVVQVVIERTEGYGEYTIWGWPLMRFTVNGPRGGAVVEYRLHGDHKHTSRW